MTKPTGRPRGRPKTKEYVTLMARVDVALADQVKRYASLHRQPISVVIRDALSLLMDEYPPGIPSAGPQRLAAHEFLSDRYKAPLDTLLEETDSAERDKLLSDINEDVVETILSGMNGDHAKGDDMVSDMNTDIMSDTKEVPASIMSDTKADNTDFDPAKHQLGKLCPRRHNYRETGQSVLRISNRHCRACDREKFHERKQAKRQAAST
jgi:hypothetical protein